MKMIYFELELVIYLGQSWEEAPGAAGVRRFPMGV